MNISSNANQKLIEWLKNAVQNKDLSTSEQLLKKFTIRNLYELEKQDPKGWKELTYVIWCISDSWGFEQAWACHYLDPEEAMKGLDEEERIEWISKLPPKEDTSPDTPLGQLGGWGLGDQCMAASKLLRMNYDAIHDGKL